MAVTQNTLLSRRAALGLGGAAVAGFATIRGALGAGEAPPSLLADWAKGWSALGKPEKLLALVAADIVYEDVAAGDVVRGVEAFRGLLSEAAAAIPDFRIELFDGLASESAAAAEYAIVGTQTGDLPYLKATGRPFRLRAASVFVVEGGKIRRESRYYDMAQFLLQLGALAPTAVPALKPAPATPGGGS